MVQAPLFQYVEIEPSTVGIVYQLSNDCLHGTIRGFVGVLDPWTRMMTQDFQRLDAQIEAYLVSAEICIYLLHLFNIIRAPSVSPDNYILYNDVKNTSFSNRMASLLCGMHIR